MAQFTTGDDVRLHYDDQGSGTPIVLIAGFRAAATSRLYQTEFLVDHGFRVISFDRRSHGLSEDPGYGHRMARHGRDLAELLAAAHLTGNNDVVLVGGSMGASTIWSYLDLFGTRGLRAVVTIDQTPKMSNEDGWEYGFYGYRADNLGTFFAAGPPDTGRGTPIDQRGARLERLVAVLKLQPSTTPATPLPATALALLRDHAVQDWRDVIARIPIPALFVAGRDSELWPCEHAPAAAALNPLAQWIVIEDCGHAANIEQPEQFNAAVLDFLG
jgi:pimeloyl-ACP methyl ester carboxylesterase